MKIQKFLIFVVAVFLGAVIVMSIDDFLGISFTDVGQVAHTVHKLTYLIWGAVLLRLSQWLGKQISRELE